MGRLCLREQEDGRGGLVIWVLSGLTISGIFFFFFFLFPFRPIPIQDERERETEKEMRPADIDESFPHDPLAFEAPGFFYSYFFFFFWCRTWLNGPIEVCLNSISSSTSAPWGEMV